MKDGQVAEAGSFPELMGETAATGDFRAAYLVQASAFADSLPARRDAGTSPESASGA
ncbi:hypothetical protein [Streptomyces qinzhouensis]|nr:hypothetical protein [Streptomyces qinzhouensis]